MLNLPVMKLGLLMISIVMQISLWSGKLPILTQVDQPEIISPAPGAALQGTVSILGTTDIHNFSFYEIAFAYDEGEESSWFELKSAKKMIREGELATWDTTTIADGAYMLRLRVHLENGDTKDVIVRGLRVRNYSIVETNTPQPAGALEATSATDESTSIVPPNTPVPTVVPSNPAQITPGQVTRFLVGGALLTAVGFFCMGLFFAMRYSQKRG
jgi:hypothetical protein